MQQLKSMRPLRVGAVAALAAITLGAVAACGSSESSNETTGSSTSSGAKSSATNTSTGTAASSKHYSMTYITASAIPALEEQAKGMEVEAKKYSMEANEQGIKFEPAAELTAMHALITRKVSVIVGNPLVPKQFETAVQAAKKAGVTVLTYEGTGELLPGVSQNINEPDEEGAAKLAEEVAQKLSGEGKPCNVAIIEGLPVVGVLAARNKGYAAGAKKAGCTILGKQIDTPDTLAEATKIADTFRSQFGSKLDAVLPYNDQAALGAVASVRPGYEPVIVGINGEAPALEALKEGKLYEDYALRYAMTGEEFAYAAHQLLTGHKVPSMVYTGFVKLTKENVGNYKTVAEVLSEPPPSFSFVKHSNGDVYIEPSVGPFK